MFRIPSISCLDPIAYQSGKNFSHPYFDGLTLINVSFTANVSKNQSPINLPVQKILAATLNVFVSLIDDGISLKDLRYIDENSVDVS